MIAAGLLTVILLVVRRKTPPAALIFAVYFVSFTAIYLLSDSSRTYVIRYLFILFIVLPVLLGAPFLWLKPKARFPAAAAVFALVFGLSQAGASRAFYKNVRAGHEMNSRTVSAMMETGEKYWISDFWTSYLLTSLSREKLIVASKDVRRYYAYELRYWSKGRNNWVIAKPRDAKELHASIIADVLDSVGVPYERKDVGRFMLIYRAGQDIFPRVFLADPPEKLPEVRLSRIETGDGELALEFARKDSWSMPGLGFKVEIPGYCVRYYPMWERGSFTTTIPFPLQEEVTIRFGFTYAGFRLDGSTREAAWTIGPAGLGRRRPELVFLEGIGPQRDVNRPAGAGLPEGPPGSRLTGPPTGMRAWLSTSSPPSILRSLGGMAISAKASPFSSTAGAMGNEPSPTAKTGFCSSWILLSSADGATSSGWNSSTPCPCLLPKISRPRPISSASHLNKSGVDAATREGWLGSGAPRRPSV